LAICQFAIAWVDAHRLIADSNAMPFTQIFTATPSDIDELGHVNNAVWVRWIQDIATSHWQAVAPAEQIAAYIWVVTRHEIDYRGNIVAGDSVTGRTWVESQPRGARLDRRVDFVDGNAKVIVQANTTWAMIDKASGRLMRVRSEIAAPFMGD
jgi:acyl-CoA thioester hydrolase